VQEVARALTGWTIANPRQGGAFRFEPRMHDDGEKVVLGHMIKAGGGNGVEAASAPRLYDWLYTTEMSADVRSQLLMRYIELTHLLEVENAELGGGGATRGRPHGPQPSLRGKGRAPA
jgi:hypothetical protein